MNERPKPKIALGYPHNGNVRECFMSSVVQFIAYDVAHEGLLGGIIPEKGLYIAGVRNNIVSKFLTTDLEWLMMIDTDQVFQPEAPYWLLAGAEEADARVVSALYLGILADNLAPMWWYINDRGDYSTCHTVTPGLQEIAGFGCGMCLIHRSVFEEMAPHYPDDPWKWFNHDLVPFNGHLTRIGEDLGFCRRVSELGIKMYGDSRVCIGHDKSQIITIETYIKSMTQRKEGEPLIERVLDARV